MNDIVFNPDFGCIRKLLRIVVGVLQAGVVMLFNKLTIMEQLTKKGYFPAILS